MVVQISFFVNNVAYSHNGGNNGVAWDRIGFARATGNAETFGLCTWYKQAADPEVPLYIELIAEQARCIQNAGTNTFEGTLYIEKPLCDCCTAYMISEGIINAQNVRSNVNPWMTILMGRTLTALRYGFVNQVLANAYTQNNNHDALPNGLPQVACRSTTDTDFYGHDNANIGNPCPF